MVRGFQKLVPGGGRPNMVRPGVQMRPGGGPTGVGSAQRILTGTRPAVQPAMQVASGIPGAQRTVKPLASSVATGIPRPLRAI